MMSVPGLLLKEELHRRKARGTDVVIGFLEAHGRARTAELAAVLEAISRT